MTAFWQMAVGVTTKIILIMTNETPTFKVQSGASVTVAAIEILKWFMHNYSVFGQTF